MIPTREWTAVVSSNVREWYWDRDAEVLDFIAAPSKGVWVSRVLVKTEWAFTRSHA